MRNNRSKYNSVLVIDDHKMVVNGIKLIIGDLFEQFYMAFDGAAGMSLALQKHPDLVIIDYALPDTSGDFFVRELKFKQPQTKILAYSFSYAAETAIKMLQAGANGYVVKTEDDEEFIKGIHLIINGRDYFCKQSRNHIVNRFVDVNDEGSISHLIANTKLSGLEINLIRLLSKQMNSKQISGHLNLSVRTVEQYRSIINRRIGAKNVAGVIKFALQNGIITIDDL